MKIVSLTAENIKKLKAVHITPAGAMVEITGKNGQGKSSVLDALWWALAGGDAIQSQPIRHGQTKARIRLDMGELVVERRFTESGSTLIVENAEGARYGSPQKMLDALLGALTFDPLAFVNEKPKDQFDTLRNIAKVDVDFEQIDGLNRADYDKRTGINREAAALRTQASAIAVPGDAPTAKIDTDALLDEMENASTTNAAIETRRARRETARNKVEELHKEAQEHREKAELLRKQAADADADAAFTDNQAAELEQQLADAEELPPLIDVATVRARLTAAEAANAVVDAVTRRADLVKQAEAKETESAGLTTAMEQREVSKAAAIEKAEMPVTGLGFGKGIVTFNGVPFDQASTAEQIRVSVSIAMAANPKLRVIRIKEGSLLDDDGLALVAAMAQENDYQVWLERVDSSGKVGVVIYDGEVVSVDGKPVEQKPAEEAAPAKAKAAKAKPGTLAL